MIHVSHIGKLQLFANHTFVKRPTEEAFQQVAIKYCFANDSTNKLKKVQMVRINVRLRIRVKTNTIASQIEQTVIRVEHRSTKLDHEVACHTAYILARFSDEINS